MDEYDGLNDQRGVVLVDRIAGDGVYVFPSGLAGEESVFPDTAAGRSEAKRRAAQVAAKLGIDWESNY